MLDIQSDPLLEVRIIRRWALLAVLVAALALASAYSALLDLSLPTSGVVLAPVLLAIVLVIELASRWEYRMRRRHTYPQRLGYELAAIHDFRLACQRSADLVGEWLRADAVVIAWLDEDGQALAPVAAYGLPPSWTETAPHVSLGMRSLKEALRRGSFLAKPSASGDPWFGGRFDSQRVIYVPLLSRDRPEGVLAIAAGRRSAEARDQRLLAALGMVTSLALDNCRLYEGEKAHAHHLQQVSRMKSDFLATISHELRTPLTSIKMAAEMLLEEEQLEDPNSPRIRLVQNIVKGASRLTNLVADLVDVSREDEFQPRLELDPVPLGDLVATAAAIIHPLVAAKHQSLEVRLASEATPVLVDRLRFEQVLINLLSNAQRY
ncbi:MAG: GAF domain-containing protein, partial [Chloroflexi bacterium]|nr:GAF domain-containing protein [Chloroflexota bacterium]